MVYHGGIDRHIIFRPYSPAGQRSDVFICTGCGKYFASTGNMTEMTLRFAEHTCEPVFMEEVENQQLGALKH